MNVDNNSITIINGIIIMNDDTIMSQSRLAARRPAPCAGRPGHRPLPPRAAAGVCGAALESRQWQRGRRSIYLFGYTWVSFGLEVVSWLLPAMFRAARAAHTVVYWVLLGCAGGGVHTAELLKGGRSWVCRSVAGRRSGSNIHSVSLLGVATSYCAGSCCPL